MLPSLNFSIKPLQKLPNSILLFPLALSSASENQKAPNKSKALLSVSVH
jgi:hypothetical protein